MPFVLQTPLIQFVIEGIRLARAALRRFPFHQFPNAPILLSGDFPRLHFRGCRLKRTL